MGSTSFESGDTLKNANPEAHIDKIIINEIITFFDERVTNLPVLTSIGMKK